MRAHVFAFVLVLPFGAVVAADTPTSYAEASALWSNSKDKPEYQQYAQEFAEFNNHFQLDSRGGCYQVGSGPVNLMLLITHTGSSQYALIERVYSDSQSQRAKCFVHSYRGLQTKVPPFVPFVMQMRMQ
jgi:hypothetical protein